MPDEGEQTIDVEKFIIHPKFGLGFGGKYWMANDIALIKVSVGVCFKIVIMGD